MSNLVLGIEVGGTKLQVVAGNAEAGIRHRLRLAVDRSSGGAGIRQQIEACLPGLIEELKPQAIGVGFGGPVDWQTGRICCSHQIEGWSEFELGAWLRKLSGLPVAVDNDANTATLGEALAGSGVGFSPVFYATLGSGVGGGLVVDGRIYHGAKPGEAEIGHVRLSRDGATVESRCSGWAVDAKIRQLKIKAPGSLLVRLCLGATGGEARHLATALAKCDAAALNILRETADDLAFGLSHVVHLFHPEIIILGGGLSLTGEPLRATVAAALPRYVMEAFRGGPQVALAALGEDAVPVGALRLAMTAT